MKRIILYIATSLDGFISRLDGSVDWLDKYSNTGEDYGYHEFYNSIGVVIMGNTTYKQILGFGEFPYKGKENYVFSRNKKGKDENVEFVSVNPKEFIESLGTKKDIWLVGGANLADEFLKYDLIDEMIITMMPDKLGDGIKLFDVPEKFKLIDEKSFENGVVQKIYERD